MWLSLCQFTQLNISEDGNCHIKFEVFTAVAVKGTLFGASNLMHAGCFLSLLFKPEDEGSMYI